MERLRQEFLAESLDGLDRMDRCLTELEARPKDQALIAEIFRAVHTLKGTTGFLGLRRVERLAHAGEQLMGDLRSGKVNANAEVVGGLLCLMDGLRAIVGLIEKTRSEGEGTDDELIERLIHLRQTGGLGEGGEEPRLEGLTEGRDRNPVVPAPPAKTSTPEQGPIRPATIPLPVSAHEKTLRIDVAVLNRMMNLVGELVLTRNQMLRSQVDAASFPELARRLDTVTADLRETVMQARMQPVAHLFGRFPRVVRDLAVSCGKQVRLELSGQETGLDKSLLEAIKDPLTHAIRNAVDHGIETPEVRRAAGKPEEGTIRLRAFHRSGWVVLEMEDDGAGISRARVLATAVARGLISDEEALSMSNREVLQLILLPGFSTVGRVTHISGRGVGMDVVKNNVERVGGTVEIESEEGRGTLVRMRVPLTLAIVPALVVETCGQSFCLPQGALAELVYVSRLEAETLIERIGDAQLFHLRGSLLPMIWLDKVLELGGRQSRQAHGFYLAVLELEGCRFGLAVDNLLAPEEIVVKPLTTGLREIGLFSGATVLGNGRLAMILDITATAVRAGIRPVVELLKIRSQEVPPFVAPRPEFLVFEGRMHGPLPERIALPLHWIERIETVQVAEIEWARGKPKLQYRGELLGLEDTGEVLSEGESSATVTELTVLICRLPSGAACTRRVGLIVRRVLDLAAGSLLAEGPGVGVDEGQMALVNNRLTVVHDDLWHSHALQEVA